jgi:hypothetical protein
MIAYPVTTLSEPPSPSLFSAALIPRSSVLKIEAKKGIHPVYGVQATRFSWGRDIQYFTFAVDGL